MRSVAAPVTIEEAAGPVEADSAACRSLGSRVGADQRARNERGNGWQYMFRDRVLCLILSRDFIDATELIESAVPASQSPFRRVAIRGTDP
jgi:hypothetical protein